MFQCIQEFELEYFLGMEQNKEKTWCSLVQLPTAFPMIYSSEKIKSKMNM